MTERKTRRQFTISLLQESISRDNAILIGEYTNLCRDTNIKFTCKCGSEWERTFRGIADKAGAYCQVCTESNSKVKLRNSIKEIYGVEHISQSDKFKEKYKQTMLEKYGTEYPMQSEEIKRKAQITIIEKYGVENISQNPIIRKKITESNIKKYGVEHRLKVKEEVDKQRESNQKKYGVENPSQVEEFKQKRTNTMIERFGVENASQSQVIKDKKRNTCLQHFGVENPLQSNMVKEKIKKSFLQIFGVENPNQCPEIRNKIKETCLKKYGVENPNQCPEIQEKGKKHSKKFKDYVMPSGNIRRVQGYEPFALDELVKIYSEDQIITDRKIIPRIKYNDNNKTRYYFPDIYIPAENKIIEVKSDYTIKCNTDIIDKKRDATKIMGYNYEIWVYTVKGVKTNY